MFQFHKQIIRALALAASLAIVIAGGGCSENDVKLGDAALGPDAGTSQQPSFTPQADGGQQGKPTLPSDDEALLLCIGTECPAPFATCAADEGHTYKCGTDLSHDVNNCGSCGNKCLTYEPLHMASRCVEGACELECMNDPFNPTDRRNCNGEVDDGCEVDVLTDHDNCGACGKACGANEPCIKGKCGCAPGQIFCDGRCVDPKTDDQNCGGCGTVCEQPTGPDVCSPMPERSYYGCQAGTCGHLKCGGFSADCDGDVATKGCAANGCEVEDLRFDKNNCGGCGIKCTGREECIDEGDGPECAVPCSRFGKVLCASNGECADLLNDPNNCGGCGNFCPLAGPNQVRSCKKGYCDYECAPGFADCNGNSVDGCEANLSSHPGNCGACGNQCDLAAGQPCVEGKCLMRACDGETK